MPEKPPDIEARIEYEASERIATGELAGNEDHLVRR